MHRFLDDPWVASQIDDAVAPFTDLLPSEEIAWMRVQLACVLEDSQEAREAMNGARPRHVDESGERGLGVRVVDAEKAG
ncbi:MAG: hypothetical protein R3B72_37405 [Polyangiaceae bacterium]